MTALLVRLAGSLIPLRSAPNRIERRAKQMMQNQAQESDTLISMRQRVRDSFERQGLMHHLGITVESIEPGEVRLKMPFRPELTQQHGFFHAGGTSALADTAGGYAGVPLFPTEDRKRTRLNSSH